jgi:hypothetical protein
VRCQISSSVFYCDPQISTSGIIKPLTTSEHQTLESRCTLSRKFSSSTTTMEKPSDGDDFSLPSLLPLHSAFEDLFEDRVGNVRNVAENQHPTDLSSGDNQKLSTYTSQDNQITDTYTPQDDQSGDSYMRRALSINQVNTTVPFHFPNSQFLSTPSNSVLRTSP